MASPTEWSWAFSAVPTLHLGFARAEDVGTNRGQDSADHRRKRCGCVQRASAVTALWSRARHPRDCTLEEEILLHTSTSSGWCSPRAVFVIDISGRVHDLVVFAIEEACGACDTLFSSRLPSKKTGRLVGVLKGHQDNGHCWMTFVCHVGVWVTCKSATARVLECDALGWIPEALPTSTLYFRGPASPCRTCIRPGEHSTRCLIVADGLGTSRAFPRS